MGLVGLCMRVLYDVTEDKYARITALVRDARFPSIQAFLDVSVDNQLYIEGSGEARQEVTIGREPSPAPSSFLGQGGAGKHWVKLSSVPSFPATSLRTQLMPFTNRIFPGKLALRVLCNAVSADGTAEYSRYCKKAADVAAEVGLYLASADKSHSRSLRMGALSTGLPTGRRGSLDLAKRKFLNHVVGGVTPGGEPYGMLLTVGVAGMPRADRIGVTEEGMRFAEIANPVLDGSLSSLEHVESPLSNEESDFYLDMVRKRLPDEGRAIDLIRSIIKEGAHSYKDILVSFCRETKASPRQAAARQLLSAELARMRELRIISSRSEGLKTFYEV